MLNILSRRGASVEFERLARWVPRIEQEIARAYSEARQAVNSDPVVAALQTLEEFTLRGGKRLRALLVLGGYHVATGRKPGPALSAAAGIEQFQSWMLIHDDIIDHAEERRGGPSVHRSLATQHGDERLLGSSSDYGVGMGITLGDLQEPFAVDAILRSPVPGPRRLLALTEYVRMTRETAYGQLLDIRNGVLPLDRVREEDVLEVHRRKSAEYTVAGPLRLGAILGGASSRLLADLQSIGEDLGVAFQLRDDVLGAGLSTEDIGKSANDLVEGKRTLLVVTAWSRADPVGRAILREVLGNASAAPARVGAAQELIRSTGSLAYSEQRISELSHRAFARIRKSPALQAGAKRLLEQVGDRLVTRAM
jgi:geranylgeranyl diphosphate synthase, type I